MPGSNKPFNSSLKHIPMRRVAIPIFLDRVSPRLDCAGKLLILGIQGAQLAERSELDIRHWGPDEKILNLRQLGIQEIICGGIRYEDRAGLQRLGIQIFSPVFGEVQTIIKQYLKGVLEPFPCYRRNRKRRLSMKIAITAKGKTLDSELDPRFGRAGYFLLVDPETLSLEVVENRQNLGLPRGAGIQAAQTLVEHGAQALITGNCGPKAFKVLEAAKIPVAVGFSGTVREALRQYQENKLSYAQGPNVEGHW